MYDKKNSVLFTNTECVVLSPDFKLLDESHVLPKVPRKDNMYSVDLRNVVPQGGLTCLFAKATLDESNLWHRRLGHINFKTMNKLVRGNLIRGLPSKIFENDHTCVACQKGKQHKASCKLDGKVDEGFFVGYSVNSKAFRVFNSRTRIVKETLHITFLENKPNVARSGPEWLFDIDTLTKSMNYKPVVTGNQSNANAGTKACDDACKARVETMHGKDYILLLLWPQDLQFSSSLKDSPDAGFKPSGEVEKKDAEDSENKDKDNVVDENIVYGCVDDPNMPNLEEIVYSDDDEDNDAEAYMNNLNIFMPVSPILTTRRHKDHPLEDIIRDIHSSPQTRRMTKSVTEHVEPKKVIQALTDPSWIKAIQDELLQNKKDERGIVVRNKARLVAQGYTQEEGIEYDAVFDLVARIEAIRMFLAYASFINFVVYHMDVKSAFLYGKIEEEIYIYQPPGFEDPKFPDRVMQKEDGIFISQDKYVDEILKKFGFSTVKTASTPMVTSKPLMKDENVEDVDVHLYRSMIGSLMYLTSSRPDIMFVVCACARFQVTPKVSHLHAMKRIFRYLKGQPKLGLWYPKDSPFDLEAYTNSDYAGASLDRKSTTGGCQFLRSRLISWQCKKIQFFTQRQSILRLGITLSEIKIHTDQNVADLLTKSFNIIHKGWLKWNATTVEDGIEVKTDKSTENADFDEIVDFINANPIRYALIISPAIYVSYIEQFWSIVKTKIVNNETQIRAKVDGKTIVITESSVRRDLHFNDEDGIACLTSTEIFENLQLMSALVTTAGVSISTAKPSTPPTITIIIEDEDLTITQTLMKMRSEPERRKPVNEVKGKDQIEFDEEVWLDYWKSDGKLYMKRSKDCKTRKEEDN
ncbi:putative ribonuclease H-like domain-containing protein [Tanacetum coccineum]